MVGLLADLVQWLKSRSCTVLLDREAAWIVGNTTGYSLQEMNERADCLLVLGGDGTLLSCARACAPFGTPLFGINLGRLGFLTETELPDLYSSLDKLFGNRYQIEKRMMLQARIMRGKEVIEETTALNEVVITKGGFARIIMLKVFVDGKYFNTYPADGLIVSTPTGSTAYSMSAGGPLVAPSLDLMIITPVCPHALWARPLIISSHSRVKVILLSEQREAMLTMDGQKGVKLMQGDAVIISRAPYQAKFIKLAGRDFFTILRKKLRQGNIDE